MANPFEPFAFNQAATKPGSARNNQLSTARSNKCVSGDTPAPASAPPVTPARRRRQSPVPADVKEHQQAAAVPSSARVTTRSSNSTGNPNSAPKPPAKKKRKAYASLTGPPKGLGPKLGTAPLRLILVRATSNQPDSQTGTQSGSRQSGRQACPSSETIPSRLPTGKLLAPGQESGMAGHCYALCHKPQIHSPSETCSSS
jgi:hypothetical protein